MINSYCGVAAIVRTFLMMVGLGLMVRLGRLMVRLVWLIVRLVRPILRRFAVLQEALGRKFKRQ